MLNLFGVVVFHRSMVNCRRGGVRPPWVYVHSAICENVFGVAVFHTSKVNWRRGWSQSALSICGFCYM